MNDLLFDALVQKMAAVSTALDAAKNEHREYTNLLSAAYLAENPNTTKDDFEGKELVLNTETKKIELVDATN